MRLILSCQNFLKAQRMILKLLDLREKENCIFAMTHNDPFDEIYHLAADMGGMGFIHSAECDIQRNNALITHKHDSCCIGNED